jgi:UDP-glucose 4-epimerase
VSWLVTGGAGYLGAHVVHALVAAGEDVVVLDDLSTGDAGRLAGLPRVPLEAGSVHDRGMVRRVLRENAVTGVVHLAGAAPDGDPLRTWSVTVEGLVALLEGCRAKGVTRFLLCSGAAVYGAPDADRVDEDADRRPTSPHGRALRAAEDLVHDSAAWGLSATTLRCAVVAGAGAPHLGDRGPGGLLPPVFEALDADRPPLLPGGDSPTSDGSPVRDVVHVSDVAAAHVAAARALAAGRPGGTYHVGRGTGTSLREVLRVVGEVTGGDTTPEVTARTPGEPSRLVLAVDRAARDLDWRATRDLPEVVASAWESWRALQLL